MLSYDVFVFYFQLRYDDFNPYRKGCLFDCIDGKPNYRDTLMLACRVLRILYRVGTIDNRLR